MEQEEIIGQIKAGGCGRQEALTSIYQEHAIRKAVFSTILKMRGNIQDAEDMYQESIIIMDRNIRHGKYVHKGTLPAYLCGIARMCWLNQLRKRKRTEPETTATDHILKAQVPGPDHWLMDQERAQLLQGFIIKLDSRCIRILQLWQERTNMQDISEMLDLSSEMMARKLKYQCTKKLAKLIQEHPEIERILKQSL
ncbi:MAG: sigma-70 family RNA polymerase sigma factor [Saprospiraceae bacterium]|nr:sigma-70 family RNA polymerase sigma factor [Saprospiraceae bacterium]